jgi:hypothetical protein
MEGAVHPHACGENLGRARGRRPYLGPPPRVWGKRPADDGADLECRSTPTRVGKTCIADSTSTFTTVHPHGGGENPAIPNLAEMTMGKPLTKNGQTIAARRGNSVDSRGTSFPGPFVPWPLKLAPVMTIMWARWIKRSRPAEANSGLAKAPECQRTILRSTGCSAQDQRLPPIGLRYPQVGGRR